MAGFYGCFQPLYLWIYSVWSQKGAQNKAMGQVSPPKLKDIPAFQHRQSGMQPKQVCLKDVPLSLNPQLLIVQGQRAKRHQHCSTGDSKFVTIENVVQWREEITQSHSYK